MGVIKSGVSAEGYKVARHNVSVGHWTVLPEIGHVIGVRGKRIGTVARTGYRVLSAVLNEKPVTLYEHRVIWESVHGPIEDGLWINHINGNKEDNRIANLELVSPSENTQHAIRTGLRLLNPAAYGVVMPSGEKHHNVKLTDEQIVEIRRLRNQEGKGLKELAIAYGVSVPQISRVANGKSRRTTTV